MNVIVSNKQKSIIDNANIDAIKDLNGFFNIDDLISKIKNYFFSKLILDATSVIDFASENVLTKLANEIGGERLFVLLPARPQPPESFINILRNLGIYNYSTDINELVRLINTPKTELDNSISSSLNDRFYSNDSVVNNENSFNNSFPNDNSYMESNDFQPSMPMNTEMVNTSEQNSFNDFSSNLPNFNNNDMVNQNTYQPEFNLQNNVNQNDNLNNFNIGNTFNINTPNVSNKMVIGFRNVTTSAGSTSLIYMLTRKLVKTYGKRAMALEINKNDFRYYQENFFLSSNEQEVYSRILSCPADVVLVDLNNCQDTSFCTDVVYLVEPSIIKLNMLMMTKPLTLKNLKGCKLVLNKSLLTPNEINAFANEAGTPIFYNIPPVNDRVENSVLDNLLNILKLI